MNGILVNVSTSAGLIVGGLFSDPEFLGERLAANGLTEEQIVTAKDLFALAKKHGGTWEDEIDDIRMEFDGGEVK